MTNYTSMFFDSNLRKAQSNIKIVNEDA